VPARASAQGADVETMTRHSPLIEVTLDDRAA
jgi:hypothetical protein